MESVGFLFLFFGCMVWKLTTPAELSRSLLFFRPGVLHSLMALRTSQADFSVQKQPSNRSAAGLLVQPQASNCSAAGKQRRNSDTSEQSSEVWVARIQNMAGCFLSGSSEMTLWYLHKSSAEAIIKAHPVLFVFDLLRSNDSCLRIEINV